MTLKERLGKLESAAAGSIDAPELGPGRKVWIARLSFVELCQIKAITDDATRDAMARTRDALVMIVVESDGTPKYGKIGEFAPREIYWKCIDEIPLPLAERIIVAAFDLNSDRGGGRP